MCGSRGKNVAPFGPPTRPVEPLRGRDARRRRAPPRRHSAGHWIVVERQYSKAHPAGAHPGGPGRGGDDRPADCVTSWRLPSAVACSVLVSGGTQAGKTTLLRALAESCRVRGASSPARRSSNVGWRTGSRGHADAPAGRGGTGRSPCETSCASPCACDRVPDRRRGARPEALDLLVASTRACPAWRPCTRTRARGPRQAFDPAAPGGR